jgi:CubicO group peptidase (beta-lactamase class C family)
MQILETGDRNVAGAFAVILIALGAARMGEATDVPPPQWSAVEIPAAQIDRAIAGIDRLAKDLMQRTGVPGMAVAVVGDDQVVYRRGFGIRKVGSPEPVKANTVFQLASVSKPLGAAVIATAAGRGWTLLAMQKRSQLN